MPALVVSGLKITWNPSLNVILPSSRNMCSILLTVKENGVNVDVIGAGGGGANTELSNLGTTAINADLNFSGIVNNAITNLGNLEFENTGQSIIPLAAGIRHDVPTGDVHRFRVNLGIIAEVTLDGIELFGNSLVLDSDGDTEINSVSDDIMQFITGGGLRMSIGNIAVTMLGDLSVDGDALPGTVTSDLGSVGNVWDDIFVDQVITNTIDDEDGGGEIRVFADWDMQAGNTVDFADTATSAGTSSQTLPAQPDGFIIVLINGVSKRVPFYVP